MVDIILPALGETNPVRTENAVRQIKDSLSLYATLISPSFTTPSLGVATATSINGLTITTTTGGVLTIASGKTLTISNTVTFAGTDGSTLNFGTGGTLGSLAFLSAAPAGTLSGTTLAAGVVTSSLTTVGTIGAGVWQGTAVGVAYGGTGQTSYTDGQLLIGNSSGNTLTKSTLTAGTGISITNGGGSITIASTGGWTLLKKSANQTVTASTTFADDSTLQFAVAANTDYIFRGHYYINPTTGGYKFAVNGPSTPTALYVNYAGSSAVVTAYDTAIVDTGGSTQQLLIFEGIFRNGANAGTLAMRIAQNSAAGSTIFGIGSYLEYVAL